MSSTQNETKEETDFATDVLTNKTDDDNSEGCDSSAEAEGKKDARVVSRVNVVPCARWAATVALPPRH